MGLAQSRNFCWEPHMHFWTLFLEQGWHSPEWHKSLQECFWQLSGFPQRLPQDHPLLQHLLVDAGCEPQKHATLTVTGQGGQGPGWQRSRHLWPQAGRRSFLQISPQEWGTKKGWYGGFSVLPQKQIYFAGNKSGGYSYRHLGQHQHNFLSCTVWSSILCFCCITVSLDHLWIHSKWKAP